VEVKDKPNEWPHLDCGEPRLGRPFSKGDIFPFGQLEQSFYIRKRSLSSLILTPISLTLVNNTPMSIPSFLHNFSLEGKTVILTGGTGGTK